MRPGVTVIDREFSRPRTAPTDTGVWFVAGMSQKGSTVVPVEITGMDDYTATLGTRVTYGFLYDSLETYFREGGGKAFVGRVVGPSAVSAGVNITSTGTTHTITANSPGDWANGATGGLTVDVLQGPIGGSTFRLYVIKVGGVEVERTPEFDAATRTVPVDWSAASSYVTITLGAGSGIPAVAAGLSLAGGTDDRSNALDAHWKLALDRFSANLGPGQVSMPGRTTAQSYADTMAHAQSYNRIALLDSTNTSSRATLVSTGSTLTGLTGNRRTGLFTPWITIAGTSAGTTRTVPPTSVVAGRIADTDRVAGPDQPAAGDYGVSRTALSLAATFSDSDAQALNEGSVNAFRDVNGDLTLYGYRTVVNKVTDPNWWMLSNSRLAMFIRANVTAIGQRYVFRIVDGQGHTLTAFGGAVDGFMQRLYLDGQIYPDPEDRRAETAYALNMSSEVNPPAQLADGVLAVDIAYRPAPFAEMVQIAVTVVPITQAVA